MAIFKGAGVAIVTPMKENQEVNYEKLEELIEHVWDCNADTLSNSVRVHMSSLRRKLKAQLGYDPICNIIGEGYVIREGGSI